MKNTIILFGFFLFHPILKDKERRKGTHHA